MSGKTASRADATRALEHELGVVLRRIRRNIATRAQMVHPDLAPASYSLLVSLHDDGPRRSSELAEMFSIDKGAVSRQVARLEALGLVERTPDPLDGRAHLLSLTAHGRSRLAEVARRRRQWYDERLADWSGDEIAELAHQLARYNEVLGRE
jgi:DNA-binding MarR family transcriptional regulator